MKASSLHSMTGYGRGSAAGKRFRVSVELRSVNGRFFELRAKVPRGLQFLEHKLRDSVAKKLKRGAVDLVLSIQSLGTASGSVVDSELARVYAQEIHSLARNLGLTDGISASTLLRLPGVLMEPESGSLESDSEIPGLVDEALSEAVSQLLEMRAREGEKLVKALERELESIHSHRDWIAKHREELNERYSKKLKARVAEWLEKNQSRLDETRLYQEVAFYLDRSDVTEELDRLGSHLKQCEETLRGASQGSAGKRLDFLAQELGREVNTIGSKNDHSQVSGHVVEMKLALERVREQVQNLE